MSLISIPEICRWLGTTVFELWMQALAFLIFSVLFVLKMETSFSHAISWWAVFSPLMVACGFHAYFTLIVFIRQYFEDGNVRSAATRALLLGAVVALLVTFEILLCLSADQRGQQADYAVTFCPIYVIMALLLVKACMLHP